MFIVSPEARMATPAKPKAQTWRDWQAPDAPDPGPLLTREQLLEQIAAAGVDVGEQNLLFWQQRGVVPYGERIPVGRARPTFYPIWMVDVVKMIRQMQANGQKLEDIRVRIRKYAKELTSAGLGGTTGGIGSGSGSLTVIPGEFAEMAATMALIYERKNGAPIERVEIRLVDQWGNPHAFAYAVGQPPTPEAN